MLPRRLAAIIVLWLSGTGFCGAATIVNCVGDSITAGVGVPAQWVLIQSYPARLQQLIGTNYSVQNDGLSGATLLKKGDTPYWNSTPYLNSYARLKPDIVIIMLGSNDSKSQNWAYGTNFYSDYADLIAVYTNVTTHPRVLLCTPPPCFGNNAPNINPGIVATNIAPLVRQLGTNLDLQVIDLQTLLAGHGEWFPDNVHPNSQGATVMAALVYAAISGDTLNGAIPNVAIGTLTNKNPVLKWPAGGAGWVLQSTPALGNPNTWIIASNSVAIGNDGTSLFFTNSVAGQTALFRLWNPLPGHN